MTQFESCYVSFSQFIKSRWSVNESPLQKRLTVIDRSYAFIIARGNFLARPTDNMTSSRFVMFSFLYHRRTSSTRREGFMQIEEAIFNSDVISCVTKILRTWGILSLPITISLSSLSNRVMESCLCSRKWLESCLSAYGNKFIYGGFAFRI